MSNHRALSVLMLGVVAALIVTACDSGDNTVIGTTAVSSAFSNSAVSVAPATVQPVGNPLAICPDPLFVVPFNVVVTADRLSDLFVTEMQMQFVDRTGIRTPTRSITRAGLLDRFDSIRIPASSTRMFPFEFPLGCSAVAPGTLTIIVFTADSQQRERQTTMRIAVN